MFHNMVYYNERVDTDKLNGMIKHREQDGGQNNG